MHIFATAAASSNSERVREKKTEEGDLPSPVIKIIICKNTAGTLASFSTLRFSNFLFAN